MRTKFTVEQMQDPAIAASEAIIRKCVHCGFCTATCPTYVLLGDELDSPRGRIALMQNMLESGRTPNAEVVKHVDRCLSCLSCMTTCPSGVNYAHLVDHARAYIEKNYARPAPERFFRDLLAWVLPHPTRFRLALALARIARPLRGLIDNVRVAKPLAAMLSMAPAHASQPSGAFDSVVSSPKGRVVLQKGCVEPVLKPEFRAATIRVLNRAGYDVVFAPEEGCCGSLVQHMGKEAPAHAAAKRNVAAWKRLIDAGPVDAILVTASGCGTAIKDYGYLLRNDPEFAASAAQVSALAKDVSEFLGQVALPAGAIRGVRVAYHAACSLQHGQKITEAPKQMLAKVGFSVRTPAEAHLCCGSAGTYNILQADIAKTLGDRKAASLARLNADVIATGNIGCAMQLERRTGIPVVHTIELIDWATGGPAPAGFGERG